MSADEATAERSDADEPESGHPEVMRGGQRVIVVNSQPRPGDDDLPPRQVRGLGAVSNHASGPVSGSEQRRRASGGSALGSIVTAAVPVLLAAFAITFLDDRLMVLLATGVLVAFWLVGLATAWRGLGPKGRDGRGAVFFGRAVGLVVGAVGAVYLLIDVVPPLL